MKVNTINYKDITIEAHYNDDKTFSAYSICGNSHNKFDSKLNNFSHGYASENEAVNDVKSIIDEFIEITPKDYNELAELLTNSLTWDGYEECHLDPQVAEILIGNFIKLQTK